MPSPGKLHCSFCGKAQIEVAKLIAGPKVYICNECIRLCNDIIAEDVERDLPDRTQSSGVEQVNALLGTLFALATRSGISRGKVQRVAVVEQMEAVAEDLRGTLRALRETPEP